MSAPAWRSATCTQPLRPDVPDRDPEGPNIGLIGSLSVYARVNPFGFIETPYRKVVDGVVTDDIDYLTADEEDRHVVAQANSPTDAEGPVHRRSACWCAAGRRGRVRPGHRRRLHGRLAAPDGVGGHRHDPVPRARRRQPRPDGGEHAASGGPLVRSEAPLVGTGMELRAAIDAGDVVVAEKAGVVEEVSADHVTVMADDGTRRSYRMRKFNRSNHGTCANQKPIVDAGQRVEAGQVIADGPCTENGEMALGKNLLVAIMPWEGHNYEDAIILPAVWWRRTCSPRSTSRSTRSTPATPKLGAEEITRDIPNVSDEVLADLDERGIVRIGARSATATSWSARSPRRARPS